MQDMTDKFFETNVIGSRNILAACAGQTFARFPLDNKGHKVIRLDKLLVTAGLCASISEAQRMIKQGAIKIDGQKMIDYKQMMRYA